MPVTLHKQQHKLRLHRPVLYFIQILSLWDRKQQVADKLPRRRTEAWLIFPERLL